MGAPAKRWRRTRGLGLALATLAALVAIPVLLITSSLRFAINAGGLYEYGFDEYGISHRTGIERSGLTRIGGEIRDYFNDDEEFIDIRATIYGEEQHLFTQREILHMKDVKGLVQGVYLWQWIALGYLLTYVALHVWWLKKGAVPFLARRAVWGGGLTLALILALGLTSLVGFDSLFLKFHQLGFSNDLWKLDPRVHNLIAMFPQGFFQDATIFVAMMTIGQALLLVGAGGGYLMWRWRSRRRCRSGVGDMGPVAEPQAPAPQSIGK